MTASITQSFKRRLADDLYNDFQDSDNNYYVGIGKSEEWNETDVAPTPVTSLRDERLLRESLQSIMQVAAADVSYVIPRYNWSSGTTYSGWNDTDTEYPTTGYYVLNSLNEVFVCLRQGQNAFAQPVNSTVEPSGINGNVTFVTSDGYAWRYLYQIGSLEANKFLAANYMPVKFVDSDTGVSGTATEQSQYLSQEAAVVGQIVGFEVDSAGAGYCDPVTVVIKGSTDSARATATVSGGGIIKVEIDDSSSGAVFFGGSGYENATVTISGGSPTSEASIRPILGTKLGFGADPRSDLKSSAIMFNVQPTGQQGDDFITGNDFRQITLLRNPLKYENDSAFTTSTGSCLQKLNLAGGATGFLPDQVIEGSLSGASAIVDVFVETGSPYLLVHQTETTGYETFDSTTDVFGAFGSLDSVTSPEVDIYSGDLLIIDNRSPIVRSDDQTEDLKPIIQF